MAKQRKRKLLALREQHALATPPPVTGFTALLYVLRPDEGGRTVPVFDGQRVQSRYTAGQPWDNDLTVRLEGRKLCQPGEECMAQLKFSVPDAVTVVVTEGSSFVLRQGPNVVVRGTLLRVERAPDHP